ncbi:AzlC family ABC transporter permease [Sabulicella rubraurantiaca]|uniref:AzlC family ABC transporter permease n=1 Tax=Sabulicella rubraurantiaca TaxID=2811429 RepID=UPI001A956A41|nr:AzlC family ABC transporter permease [Sabulicella rubraurantiaca]
MSGTGPFARACREALGAPALAMAATFLAFGTAAAAAGLSLGWTLLAALGVYGMPGQMILLGGGGVAAAVAANARFLPMAVSLSPWLGRGGGRWLSLPFIAVTPWAMAMRRLPHTPPTDRLRWFLGFALTSWIVAGLSALAGFLLAGRLPGPVLAVLLLTNPIYFGLIVADAARVHPARLSVACGLLATPLALVLPASLGLLAAGLVGGSVAFALSARRRD